jgi:hypothetical protein
MRHLGEYLGVLRSHGLLVRALTHRSYAYENGGLPTNERLEFLGDAVLGLVVTSALFRNYPDLPEGQLAKLRASVVNMHALAGENAVLEWASGSSLRPFLDRLPDGQKAAFGQAYSEAVRPHYPRRADGTTLLPFQRLYMVARTA